MHRRSILLASILPACASQPRGGSVLLDRHGFAQLLNRLAVAWNSGDSRIAAECFASDAIYVEPPQKQVYRGREALFRFFGGTSGRPGAMSMTWHRTVFDEQNQGGVGEFTFKYGTQVHGVAIIQIRNQLIGQWREYWYPSDKPFQEFIFPTSP